MPHIIIIERNATLKEYNVKDSAFIEETLYKKIGLKSNNNFERIYSIVCDEYSSIYIYGKKNGKRNFINIYPFATTFCDSIGTATFTNSTIYGNCIILKLDTINNLLLNFQLDDFAKFVTTMTPPPPVPIDEIATDTSKKTKKTRTKNETAMKHISQKTLKGIEQQLVENVFTGVVEPIDNHTANSIVTTITTTFINYEKELEEEEYIL